MADIFFGDAKFFLLNIRSGNPCIPAAFALYELAFHCMEPAKICIPPSIGVFPACHWQMVALRKTQNGVAPARSRILLLNISFSQNARISGLSRADSMTCPHGMLSILFITLIKLAAKINLMNLNLHCHTSLSL